MELCIMLLPALPASHQRHRHLQPAITPLEDIHRVRKCFEARTYDITYGLGSKKGLCAVIEMVEV